MAGIITCVIITRVALQCPGATRFPLGNPFYSKRDTIYFVFRNEFGRVNYKNGKKGRADGAKPIILTT